MPVDREAFRLETAQPFAQVGFDDRDLERFAERLHDAPSAPRVVDTGCRERGEGFVRCNTK